MYPYLLMFLLLLTGNTTIAATEIIKYDVYLMGDKIGYMHISRETKDGGIEIYTLQSYSKAKVLWINKEVSSHTTCTYKDGKLISSVFKETENGEVKRWYNVSYDGKQYTSDGYKGKRTFTQAPVFSVCTIFYKEPAKATQVFDEAEANFNNFSHPEANTCEFKSANGTRNVYHLVNGRVQTAEFHVSIATVKMVRVN